MIPPSWPFAVWGLDILGPFPRAVGGYRYLYVAIDKFTKWPKATPVVNITKVLATAFLKSIVSQFGVPNRVITTMGLSSLAYTFKSTARALASSSVSPQWRIPGAMAKLSGLMLRSSEGSRSGPTAILRNMAQNGLINFRAYTGETPFFLVYGAEACLPPEITMGSLRVQAFDEDLQKQQRRQDVDLIDERRW
jgi:hypothetical protein